MDDCEAGHRDYRSQHRTTQFIQQHVTNFCRNIANNKPMDRRRFNDSKNIPGSSSSPFNKDKAFCKLILHRRGTIVLGSALLWSFVLLQHTLVNQSKFLYEIHLQQRRSIFLEQATNTRIPTTGATLPSSLSLHELANNSDQSNQRPSQRMATSTGTILDDDNTDSVICWPWSYSSDEWWTHHPTWKRSRVNATHYCYQKIQNERQAALYQAIYDVQFRHAGDCQNMFRRHMWSSGLGADFINVNRGLFQAVLFQRPFQITDSYPWHYAAGKGDNLANETMAACPSRDMYCYFLPLTDCPVGDESSENETLLDTFYADGTPLFLPTSNDNFNDDNYTYEIGDETVYQWIFEYATRPQTWLWRKVYEYTQSRLNLTTPCMVMHVRRADVIHHSDGFARRYFSIAEYVNASKRANILSPNDDDTVTKPNIFLITDDANAIGEALSEFPTYNWMYIRRKRYKADEGGWEEQTPSRDYVFEMTTLLSILELAPHCSAIVHGQSSFADLVVRSMESHHGRSDLRIARVDDNITIFDAANSQFRNVSKEYQQIQEQRRHR
ncbi:hypothetical protein IV203_021456 [Nitzschia inconspicua]|uniref:Alpha-(1,6)-fucosyltransferase N- and catalytic domain-containing protein n=1 Tax=Nitzschia inconspicua TaxID=303405 RepID=A0A9K3PE86_9STRA|nr:hypothetical protein IV203_021456 [Nitzschia inconspicua]